MWKNLEEPGRTPRCREGKTLTAAMWCYVLWAPGEGPVGRTRSTGEGCSLQRRAGFACRRPLGVITRTMMTRRTMTASQGAQKVDADVPSIFTGKGQPRVEQQVCLHLFHWLLSYVDVFLVGPSTYVERRRQSITFLEEDAHDTVESAATRRRSIFMSARADES